MYVYTILYNIISFLIVVSRWKKLDQQIVWATSLKAFKKQFGQAKKD